MAVAPGTAERARHWDEVYQRLDETRVSWFEPEPAFSVALLDELGVGPGLSVVDIGAGAARLVDALLARGFGDLTALDVSDEGMAQARRRLGRNAGRVRWVAADVRSWHPGRRFDVWHDRAVFHFLTEPADRDRYLAVLAGALSAGGRVVIGTFAGDGPPRCSGLPVARYSPAALASVLGDEFEVVRTCRQEHRTPAGVVQPFTWLAARRRR